MRTVLVAGGAGYIGSVLCEMLLDEGWKVVCLDRLFFGGEKLSHLRTRPEFSLIRDDIRYVGVDAFSGVDVAIDLAGISNDPACELDPHISEDINYKGALRFARMAKEAGVTRYVYSSSCSVYGDSGNGEQVNENSLPSPISLYAKLKLRVEDGVRELMSDEFCVTCLRNATVYGVSPRMRFDLIVNIMTAHAVTKRKIFVLGGGRQWRPIVHIKDVARAFVLTVNAPVETVNGETINVGANEQDFQVIQVANMIRDVVPYTTVDVVPDDADKRNYSVRFDKIGNVLCFRVNHSAIEGAVEVKQAIEKGTIDIDDVRTSTVRFYKYLIEADRILSEVKINGKLF
jgi:nucleoside-diphosphate-sugar epimerase